MWFYFICRQCGAKWFEEVMIGRCPRCGKLRYSGDRQQPPWMKR